jgi:hypothetical protein
VERKHLYVLLGVTVGAAAALTALSYHTAAGDGTLFSVRLVEKVRGPKGSRRREWARKRVEAKRN